MDVSFERKKREKVMIDDLEKKSARGIWVVEGSKDYRPTLLKWQKICLAAP